MDPNNDSGALGSGKRAAGLPRPPVTDIAYQLPQKLFRAGGLAVEALNRTVADGPTVGAYDAIVFSTWQGTDVLIECKDGRRARPMYPPANGREYYKQGDLIMLRSMSKRKLEGHFPELKAAQDEDLLSELGILLAFAGWEAPQYKVAWMINSIDHTGRGRGSAKLRGVVFFGGTPVVLEKEVEFYWIDLNGMFTWARQEEVVKATVGPILDMAALVAGAGVGGVAQSVRKMLGKKLARYAVTKGLRKIFFRVARILLHNVTKAVTAFLQAFAEKLFESQYLQSIEAKAKGEDVATVDILPMIIEASGALAMTLVEETFNDEALKKIEPFLGQVLGLSGLQLQVHAYVLGRIVKLFTVDSLTIVQGATVGAALDASEGKGDFDQLLADKLRNQLTELLHRELTSIVEGIVDDLVKHLPS